MQVTRTHQTGVHSTTGAAGECREIPTVQRPNRGWMTQMAMWTVLTMGGLWLALHTLLSAGTPAALFWALGIAAVFFKVLQEPRQVTVDSEGVHLHFLVGTTDLPWDQILAIEDGTLVTADRTFALPRGLRDREAVARLIGGILRGAPLLSPEALPKPSWELLEARFGPRNRANAIRVPDRCNVALEIGVGLWLLVLGPMVGLLSGLTGAGDLGRLWWALTLLVVLPTGGMCLLDRLRYPSAVLLDPEGISLRYLFWARRYLWSEIVAASEMALHTNQDPISLAPPGSINLAPDRPLSRRLAELVAFLRNPQEGVMRLPPDDAERSLVMVAAESGPPSGRELAETRMSEDRVSGRELQENPTSADRGSP